MTVRCEKIAIRSRCVLFLLAALTTTIGCSSDTETNAISVTDIWSMPVQGHSGNMADHPGSKEHMQHAGSNGVVYLKIHNSGAPDRLVAVVSDVCQVAEIHQTTVENDRMEMKRITGGVSVGTGETIAFKPRNLHIMLIGLHKTLTQGDEIDLTLQFEKAGSIKAVSKVRAF